MSITRASSSRSKTIRMAPTRRRNPDRLTPRDYQQRPELHQQKIEAQQFRFGCISLLRARELEKPSRHSGPRPAVERGFPTFRCQFHEVVDLIPHIPRQGLRPCNPFLAFPDQTSSPVIDPHWCDITPLRKAPANLNTYIEPSPFEQGGVTL